MTSQHGKVYLVGAGPGDIGLITVRGMECLRRADVIVYDNLANPSLLEFAPRHCQMVYAGKEASRHHKSQDEINDLLAGFASEGKTIVRLKGGDPFLFGRGGEEAAYLSERNIPFEVVPGVTSAIAVPAYAGIPVTHRMVNGSLHIITGHENVEGVGPEVDWSLLARSRGSIVFLMGVGNLEKICESLVRHGMNPDTPAAMVRWGTLPEQKTLVSTVSEIARKVRDSGFHPPAVGIIGDVVHLRSTLKWFESRPLYNRRIAVTRPIGQHEKMVARLRDYGCDVLAAPTIRIVPRPLNDQAVSVIGQLKTETFDWTVFSSANAVHIFFDQLIESGSDTRIFHTTRVACIGSRTALALKSRGILPDMTATESTQEGLARALHDFEIYRILMPGAAQARTEFHEAMARRNVPVTTLAVYDIQPDSHGISLLVRALRRRGIDMISFTSSLTFTSLADELSLDELHDLLGPVALASIGPVTTSAIRKTGLDVTVQAPLSTTESLSSAMVKWLSSHPEFRNPSV